MDQVGRRIRDAADRWVPSLLPVARFLRTGVVRNVDSFRVSSSVPQPPGDMANILFSHEGRKVTKWLHYCQIYDELFGPWREIYGSPAKESQTLRILEIGVFQGGSLELWRKFFGPNALIFGVDIDPRCKTVERDDLHVRIGSQADSSFLRSVVEEMGGVDIVLDDGSHIAKDQRASFDALFPLLSDGGVYVCEDTHTAYWLRYGGGRRRPGTFIELTKGLVDGLHRWYFAGPLARRSRQAATEITSVQCFDSIVAIRKGCHSRPQLIERGSDSF